MSTQVCSAQACVTLSHAQPSGLSVALGVLAVLAVLALVAYAIRD